MGGAAAWGAALVVSPTQPLERIASAGSSRELFELLGNRRLHIPPLRERREDVPALCQHFLQRFGALRSDLEISDGALWVLESHDWPGNVRELETAIERACAAAPGGTIALEHLPPALRELHGRLPERSLVPSPRQERIAIGGGAVAHASSPSGHVLQPQPPATGGLREPWEIGAEDPISLDLYEKKALLRALHETGGDKLAAARLLKVGKSTLYRKLKRFGIA
jgi:two-component system response regulator HydG